MRAEVEGHETGLSFGIGRIAAEVGQRVRVLVIVTYRAVGIMVLFLGIAENGRRLLEWY